MAGQWTRLNGRTFSAEDRDGGCDLAMSAFVTVLSQYLQQMNVALLWKVQH